MGRSPHPLDVFRIARVSTPLGFLSARAPTALSTLAFIGCGAFSLAPLQSFGLGFGEEELSLSLMLALPLLLESSAGSITMGLDFIDLAFALAFMAFWSFMDEFALFITIARNGRSARG